MQPRDLHRPPKSTSPVVSCLQGSCLLLVLGLVYGALRAQPAEGPTVVYEHTPALRPVPGTSHVEARIEPVPRANADVVPVAPMPVPRAAEATPPPQEDGPGRSLPAVRPRGSQAGATGLASAPSLGLRTHSPLPVSPVYLDHLSYMEKHPGNGKAATVDSWKAGVGGYDRGLGSRQAELLAIAFQSGPHRHRTASAPPPHHPRTAPAHRPRAFSARGCRLSTSAGWRDADSPPGLEAGGASSLREPAPPVLTGNAWHFGHGRCPAACSGNGGVCLPALGRCDCPRHRWGPTCEILVQPAVARPERFNGWYTRALQSTVYTGSAY